MDFCMEIIVPLVIIIAFIMLVILVSILFIYVTGDCSKRNQHDVDEETDNTPNMKTALIVLGDYKIEIEVSYFDIDDNIIEVGSSEGKVYITELKNVLLMSE